MKIKNYIWDFDGTLMDTYPVMLEALEQTIEAHSIKFEGNLAHFVKNYSISKFALVYANQKFMTDFHERERDLTTEVKFYPKIPEILINIVKNGQQNFIISHRDNATYAYLGEFRDLFTEIVTSDDGFSRKPDPAAINYLVDKYNLERSQTVMIGDRPLDVEAGKNAKIKTILFDELNFFTHDTVKVDRIIHKWEEFNDEY
ncbi:phosphoglycolate phosphatase [Lactococcus hodotermopsidis]|uniref:Phosphoglycolate phosphatase n=1 Tax=Pseudolactococcus hodotermopsidis TaxID=2709157 RepID=A0A6A0BEM9_9LACT|nr:HAD-IA family hydrolase [Lactococcus hodotermopsidis]GFH43155.1 phosphoglycolate phosphatase [Lactococcus hodotermopsidis]